MDGLNTDMKTYSFTEYALQRDEQEYKCLKARLLREQDGIYGGVFGLTDTQIDAGLDAIKLGLDAWGLEQFTGWIGDLISGGISALQGGWKLYKGDKAGAADHGLDAAISLVSAIPMGDIAKLLKLRYGPKYAKMFIKAGRTAKTGVKTHKAATTIRRTSNVARNLGGNVPQKAQEMGRQARQYTDPVLTPA